MNITENKFMLPFGVYIDPDTGIMKDPTRVLTRKASDMLGYYADADALQRLIDDHNNPLHYEVFEVPVPEEYGQLMYCISKLQPGVVGDEFFMTKGHYHTVPQTRSEEHTSELQSRE